MNKTNRTDDNLCIISLIAMGVMFWLPIVLCIIGADVIALIALIPYTFFNMMFWNCILKNEPIWKIMLGFLIMESLPNLLLVIIFAIKGLL